MALWSGHDHSLITPDHATAQSHVSQSQITDVLEGESKQAAHRKLEEPAEPSRARLMLQRESAPANEAVAIVFSTAVSKAVTNQVEKDGAEASIQQVLQDDIFGVLGAHGPHRELHISRCGRWQGRWMQNNND